MHWTTANTTSKPTRRPNASRGERAIIRTPILLDATTASRTTIKTRTQQIVNIPILKLFASRKLPGHAMRELSHQAHNTTCASRTRDRSGCARMIGRRVQAQANDARSQAMHRTPRPPADGDDARRSHPRQLASPLSRARLLTRWTCRTRHVANASNADYFVITIIIMGNPQPKPARNLDAASRCACHQTTPCQTPYPFPQ